jgi:hypothetical protein
MEAGVRLTVVPSQGEAEMICGMLRAAGIKCAERMADASALAGIAASGAGWHEVLVAEDRLDDARKLLEESER